MAGCAEPVSRNWLVTSGDRRVGLASIPIFTFLLIVVALTVIVGGGAGRLTAHRGFQDCGRYADSASENEKLPRFRDHAPDESARVDLALL
jgi:hypothetical protein